VKIQNYFTEFEERAVIDGAQFVVGSLDLMQIDLGAKVGTKGIFVGHGRT
jgi:hypothetical protein